MKLKWVKQSQLDVVEKQASWNKRCLPNSPCDRCKEERRPNGNTVAFFGDQPLLPDSVFVEGDKHLTAEEVNTMLQTKYKTPGIYVSSFKPTREHYAEKEGASIYVHVAGKIVCEVGFETLSDYLEFDEYNKRPWKVIVKRRQRKQIWKRCPNCCHRLTT